MMAQNYTPENFRHLFDMVLSLILKKKSSAVILQTDPSHHPDFYKVANYASFFFIVLNSPEASLCLLLSSLQSFSFICLCNITHF